jgi:Domain of unknown function DUF29
MSDALKSLESRASASPSNPEDYAGWLATQASLLRSGRFDAIDAAGIANELDEMGRAERDRLTSAFRVLLMHMLKWDGQPEKRSRSGRASIHEQRRRIARLLNASPSLRPIVPEAMADAYGDALPWAALETGLADSDFPKACPYGFDDVMERPFEIDER